MNLGNKMNHIAISFLLVQLCHFDYEVGRMEEIVD